MVNGMPIVHMPIRSVTRHHLLSPPARNTPTAVVMLKTFKQQPSTIIKKTLDARLIVSAGRFENGKKMRGFININTEPSNRAATEAYNTNCLAIS